MKNGHLINAIVKSTHLSHEDSEKVVATAIDAIADALAKEKTVQIHGFGTFALRQHSNQESSQKQNPIDLVFTPGKTFRETVKKNHSR